MANPTKYAIGDLLSIVDLNGKVYRLTINSIAQYSVAKLLGNIEVLAQSYPPPNDTVNPDTTLFYICGSIPGETATFSQLILWDQIIDHEKSSYITTKSVYRMDIIPIPVVTGQAARPIEAIIADIKTAVASKVMDASITYTDITTETESELDRMKAAVVVALDYFDEISELESIRPLIADLKSIDFQNLTSGIMKLLSNIQARLLLIDAGGSNLALNGSSSIGG